MTLKFDGFDWDDGNITKNRDKHGVTCEEIESFLKNTLFMTPDVQHSDIEQRYIVFGKGQNSRPMVGAITFKYTEDGSCLVRPISIRYMHSKEVKKYEEKIAKTNNR
ncbi:BrnT family toxin [Spirobacillus cienkowskii]|uniref:BrnT family toxin n=1 Tax=Spirobacillus cienkowskii TaxID=495820 RepID=UPI0030D4BB4F